MDVKHLSDSETIEKLSQYFRIEELVDKATFEKFNNKSWQFLDIRLLKTLLIIRTKLNKSMYINNSRIRQ